MLLPDEQARLTAEQKRAALDAILRSQTFARADQMRQLLRYVGEMEIAGQEREITEYLIGIHALSRPAGFSPLEDATVRTRARLLRQRLAEYYTREAPDSEVQVDLPKGSYVPRFAIVGPKLPLEAIAKPDAPVNKAARQWQFAAGALILGVVLGAGVLSLLSRSSRAAAEPDPVLLEAWGPLAHGATPVLICLGTQLQFMPVPTREPANKSAYDAPPGAAEHYAKTSSIPPGTTLHLYPNQAVRVGDALGVANAVRFLTTLGIPSRIQPENMTPKGALRLRNVLLFGTPDHSPATASLFSESHLPFQFDVETREFVHRGGRRYGTMYDANGRISAGFGVLTVLPSFGSNDGQFRTVVVSSPLSAAAQAVLEYYTSAESLRDLKRRFEASGRKGFPQTYQVLIRCRTDGVALLGFEYITHDVPN